MVAVVLVADRDFWSFADLAFLPLRGVDFSCAPSMPTPWTGGRVSVMEKTTVS
jgi:hypothetical protein